MKKIITFLSYFLVFTFVYCTPAIADIQEGIRSYLREWYVRTPNKSKIAEQLGVSSTCLSTFIAPNSTKNSPKITSQFQKRYPELYNNLMISFKTRRATVSQVSPVVFPVAPIQRLEDNPLFPPTLFAHTPLVIAHPEQGPLSITPHSLNDVYVRTGVQAFHELPPICLSFLPLSHTYVRDLSGFLGIENIGKNLSPFEIRIYGPDDGSRFGWVTKKENDSYECFARAIKSEEPRLALPVRYPVGCGADGSHLVDRLLTPHPNRPFNSNKDPINFVEEEPVLNQNVRKALTQEMGFSAYRQLQIRNKNAPTLPKRRKLEFLKRKNRWSRVVDGEIASVPTSSIFLGMRSLSAPIEPPYVVYYLPENNLAPGASIYKKFYQEAKEHNRSVTYRSDVIPQFEIKNASHLFLPLIFDERKSPLERKIEFYRAFYLGINLFPFVSVSDALSFLHKLHIPFSWNGTRGYTEEQVRKMVSQAHAAALTIRRETVFEVLEPQQFHWNNFKLPSSVHTDSLQWEDAEDTLIPTYPQILRDGEVTEFRRYVGTSLLEQAIKSPLATSKMRLKLAEKYIQENELKKAEEILQLAFQQIDREGTISEGLCLLRLYMMSILKSDNLERLDDQQAIISTRELIERKKVHATVEDLIKLKHFNEQAEGAISPFDDCLRYVKKIAEDNCRIIKSGNLLPQKISKLKKLLSVSQLIEEFSLQDTFLSIRDIDCWVTVAWTEDDSIEDYVSEEEYFWEYQKPLFYIMESLEKHAMSLKKLNFRNLAFGFFDEEENRISYRFDVANVIKTLYSVSLPELEELHITGVLANSNEDAITLFENLYNHFPRLQKLYFSLNNQTKEYELTPDVLPKAARIFRGNKEDELIR